MTVDGSTFGGSTGTAMVFLDTTGNFTSTDTSVERTGGQVFSFQNTDGIFDLTATTVVANDNDEQLFGSLLDGVAGTYTFGSVAMTNVFNDGIAVVHSPNAAVGFPNGLTLTNALDDAVVLLDNDNGSFQVTGLNVTAASGRGLFADHLGVGTPPTITINGVSSINATGGAALDIDTASLAATFVSLSSSGSSASGIDVTNSIGTLTSGTTTVTTPGTDGISLLNNPGATFDFGTLSNITTTNGRGIFAANSGTVTIGNSPSISAVNGAAVDVTSTSTGAGWSFDSVSSMSSPSTGINLSNVSGSFIVTSVDIDDPAGAGIALFDNVASVTFTSGDVTGAGGVAVDVNDASAPVTYGGTIHNSMNLSVQVLDRAGGTVAFNGNIVDTGEGILLDGNSGSINFTGGLDLDTEANDAFHRPGRRHGERHRHQHHQHDHRHRRHFRLRDHRRERGDIPKCLGGRRGERHFFSKTRAPAAASR